MACGSLFADAKTYIHFLVIVAIFLISVYFWHWRWFEGLGITRNATQTPIEHMYRFFSLYLLSPSHRITLPTSVWHIMWCVVVVDIIICISINIHKNDTPNGSEREKNENAILVWWRINWKWKPKPPSRFSIATKQIQSLNIYLFWHVYLAMEFFLIAQMKIYFTDWFFSCRHSING